MPIIGAKGSPSSGGFGQFAQSGAVNYIEDVFSTFLTTGASANITVVNGIDLSGKGGLVWQKTRTSAGFNTLFDTVRGINNYLVSNNTNAQASASNILPTFNSDGFVIGTDNNLTTSGENGVSWTFAKQPKFFDVVTYTGTGSAVTVNHNLGSTPGCIIIKATSNTGNWHVWHRSVVDGSGYGYLVLNSTAATAGGKIIDSTSSTNFVVASGLSDVGYTYVCYVFAHDAGGFGLTGTDNVISCGSFTASAGQTTVTLGYEPQWILIKETSASGDNWKIWDTMRGWSQTTYSELYPNTSAAQAAGSGTYTYPTATGFVSEAGWLTSGSTYIYIAIRRGPMKVPTSGTSVFIPITSSATTGTTLTTTFPVDMQIAGYRTIVDSGNRTVVDRLRGASSTTTSTGQALLMSSTATETSASVARNWDNTGFQFPSYWSGDSTIFYSFRRAPSFFDEVCYTGTGVARTVTHNLTVVPELLIVKSRTQAGTFWTVQVSALGPTKCLYLQTTDSVQTRSSPWNDTAPTSSVFTVGTDSDVNGSGQNIVAYLFATCAGVSKVGSYTGTATTKQIDCGFTGGARFVLIKRTDSTGSWYVWDSSRGIVSGNDPYLLLNSTAAEVTNTDYIDAYSAGFEISSTAPAEINASGGTYIFLSIA
jgi:hypothetical protein